MRIGIDIGGVIIDRVKNGQYDTSFKSVDYTQTPPVEGAFESIRELVSLFDPSNVFLVSVCDEDTQRKTNEWLEGNNFYEFTGFLPENSYNCKERSQKTTIAKDLNLTHFIDDRPDVLEYMEGVVPHLYLLNTHGNKQEGADVNAVNVHDWREALAAIKLSV